MPQKSKIRVIKIVVDTNIIFSVLLNTNGLIGELLFNSEGVYEFYSCDYMRSEIEKHCAKLKRISKLTEQELDESRFQVFSKINFINEKLIPSKIWLTTQAIVEKIDIDDAAFVALSKYLKGGLWTGDKVLHSGLRSKKFKSVFNTTELNKHRELALSKKLNL